MEKRRPLAGEKLHWNGGWFKLRLSEIGGESPPISETTGAKSNDPHHGHWPSSWNSPTTIAKCYPRQTQRLLWNSDRHFRHPQPWEHSIPRHSSSFCRSSVAACWFLPAKSSLLSTCLISLNSPLYENWQRLLETLAPQNRTMLHQWCVVIGFHLLST